MRWCGIILSVALLCSAGSAWASDAQTLLQAQIDFRQGGEAYKSGAYEQAVKFYQKVLDAKVASAALYYNLGNSYFRSGQIGFAVLNYRRALRIDPRDADIRANYRLARSVVLQGETAQKKGALERCAALFESLSEEELIWFALILFMVISSLGLWGIFSVRGRRRILIGLLLGVMLWLGSLLALIQRELGKAGAAVIIDQTEARFEPSAEATIYFRLAGGSEIRILRKQENWLKIERSDGRSGWIQSGKAEKL